MSEERFRTLVANPLVGTIRVRCLCHLIPSIRPVTILQQFTQLKVPQQSRIVRDRSLLTRSDRRRSRARGEGCILQHIAAAVQWKTEYELIRSTALTQPGGDAILYVEGGKVVHVVRSSSQYAMDIGISRPGTTQIIPGKIPSSRYRSRKVTALVTNSNRAARDEAILLNALPPCVQPPTETISRRCGNRSFRSRNRSNPFCPASSSYSGLRELMRELASSTPTNADSSFSYPIHWLPRYAYGHCPIASQTVRQLHLEVPQIARTIRMLTLRTRAGRHRTETVLLTVAQRVRTPEERYPQHDPFRGASAREPRLNARPHVQPLVDALIVRAIRHRAVHIGKAGPRAAQIVPGNVHKVSTPGLGGKKANISKRQTGKGTDHTDDSLAQQTLIVAHFKPGMVGRHLIATSHGCRALRNAVFSSSTR
uniref:Uncharacterized protein n=1 Tax=Anopheles coluzzii TaxID=1518534 RepID=A0A8W7PTJ5_ANOCL